LRIGGSLLKDKAKFREDSDFAYILGISAAFSSTHSFGKTDKVCAQGLVVFSL
jgi:hypothetical protein